jgi:hypothetical protein
MAGGAAVSTMASFLSAHVSFVDLIVVLSRFKSGAAHSRQNDSFCRDCWRHGDHPCAHRSSPIPFSTELP